MLVGAVRLMYEGFGVANQVSHWNSSNICGASGAARAAL